MMRRRYREAKYDRFRVGLYALNFSEGFLLTG